jgi:hypothetical protein
MVPIQPSADAATHDTPLPDLQVKATDLSAPDSSTPIPAGPDAALLDAAKPDNQLFDVPLTADVQSPDGPTIDRPASDTRLASDVPPPDSLLPDSAARDSGPQKPSVLFVVGPSAVLGTGDSVIQAHLVANGYDVTYVREVNLGDSPTVTATMVLISHSITTNNVNNKFRNVAKPVMVWAPALYTNMGLVDGTVPNTQGTTNQIFGPTTLNMKAGAGALAAGLSGTVTVLKLPDQMNYGVPNAQALSVASLPNQSNQWGIFAYETGTQMYGLLAPARRVGFFLSQNGAVSLNANGWALFDAAVAWLAKSN